MSHFLPWVPKKCKIKSVNLPETLGIYIKNQQFLNPEVSKFTNRRNWIVIHFSPWAPKGVQPGAHISLKHSVYTWRTNESWIQGVQNLLTWKICSGRFRMKKICSNQKKNYPIVCLEPKKMRKFSRMFS